LRTRGPILMALFIASALFAGVSVLR
jgi:hypothetical protein